MYPSLIEIGSKTAEKNSAQTNRQTNRQTDYENNGHLAVNQYTMVCDRGFGVTIWLYDNKNIRPIST